MSAPKRAKKVDIKDVLVEYIPTITGVLEKFIPREFNTKYVTDISGNCTYSPDASTLTKAISEPIWDILDRGGKRWRSTLIFLIAEVLGKDTKVVEEFCTVSEIIHNGTLVIDDIEDSSEIRRGEPCSHIKYGVDVAVNAGNAMYYLPLQVFKNKRKELGDEVVLRCYELYSQEMVNLHFGQGMDIWWHSSKSKGESDPQLEHYLQMCAFKTGTLARLSAKLSALVCGGSDEQIEAIGKFAEAIGVAFQIQDDILNLTVEELKGVIGEDIHEGKKTLMVLHCFEKSNESDGARLREILESHPALDDQTTIKEAIALIKKTDSISYATEKAREIASNAWKKVDPIFEEGIGKEKLHAFVLFLIERQI